MTTSFDYDKCEHRFGNNRRDARRRSVMFSARCRTCKLRVRVRFPRGGSTQSVVIFTGVGAVLAHGTASTDVPAEDRLNLITAGMSKGMSVMVALLTGTASP